MLLMFDVVLSARSEMKIKGLGIRHGQITSSKDNIGSTVIGIEHTDCISLLSHPLSRS